MSISTGEGVILCDNALSRGCGRAEWRHIDAYATTDCMLWGYLCPACAEREGHLVPYLEPIAGTMESAAADRNWVSDTLLFEAAAFYGILVVVT